MPVTTIASKRGRFTSATSPIRTLPGRLAGGPGASEHAEGTDLSKRPSSSPGTLQSGSFASLAVLAINGDDSWYCLAVVRSVLVRRLLRSCWGPRCALVAGVLGWIGTCVAAARVPRCAVVRRAGRKELIAVAVAFSFPPVSHSRSRHGRRPRRESYVGVLESRSALVISRARRAIAAAEHGHRTGRMRHVEQYASGPRA